MATHGLLLPTRGSVVKSRTSSDLTAKTQADVIQLARRAEAYGFDAVWIGDSLFVKPRHDPLTTLAAIASQTDVVRLGTAVYLPPLRHPVSVAHETATLDQISQGRFVFGVGTGSKGVGGTSVEHEYDAVDVSWADRGVLFDEGLEILTRLWAGETVSYDGDHYTLDEVALGFEPNRPPPIYFGSIVHPEKGILRRTRERIATFGDGWMPFGSSPAAFENALEGIEATMADAGRDPGELEKTYYLDTRIAESEEAAIDDALAFIREYYPALDVSESDLRARGVFGPPERILESLERYEQAGVEHFVVRFLTENQHEQLNRFADIV